MVGDVQSEQGGIPPWRPRGLVTGQGARAQMLTGLIVMSVGVLLLLGHLGVFYIRIWHLWPVLLIGLGAAKLASPAANGARHGFVLMTIGVWLLLDALRIMRTVDSWPLLLVAFGIRMVWNAVAARGAESGAGR